MAKLSANPTPKAFARAWAREVLAPAVKKLAGDGRLTRAEAGEAATLTGNAKRAADDVAAVFEATKVKSYSAVTTVLAVGERYAERLAGSVAGSDGKLQAAEMAQLSTLSADFGWLVKPAAKEEIGVVSDLDSTVIPPETDGELPRPYPGVAELFRQLELARGGEAGDVRYVTARSPDRVTGIPAYLDEHGLPEGSIDTGTSQLPWVAQPEKVRDISRIFDANPDQSFVLFGDSSHRDPEVYREILNKYPGRVTAVFIHKVNKTVKPERVAGMSLIESYAEAAAQLLKAGVLTVTSTRAVLKAAQREGLPLTNAELEQLIAANR